MASEREQHSKRSKHSNMHSVDLYRSRAQCYISAFFIISPRGSTILSKDFRSDLPSRKCVEIFWQNIKKEEQQFESCHLLKSRDVNQNANDEPCSFFNIQNITYIYFKNTHSIYYVMITKCNICPSFAMESLRKLIQSFCDYCGRRTMTEPAIQDNFILLYELVDEYFDNGYVQIPSVNDLLNLNVIYNQPTLDNLSEIWNLLLTADLIASHTDSSRHRSHNTAISSFAPPPHPTSTVIESPDKNQIFVDLVEYINVTSQSFYYRRNHISSSSPLSSNNHSHIQQYQAKSNQLNNGYLHLNQTPIVQNSSIHGTVTMKVFLSNEQESSKNKAKNKNKDKKKKAKNGKLKRKKSKIKFGKFGKNKHKNKQQNEDDHKSNTPSASPPPVLPPEMQCAEYLESLPPGIRLQFNDDLIIGRENAPPYNKIFGALILDDVAFHQKLLCSQQDIQAIIEQKERLLSAGKKAVNNHANKHAIDNHHSLMENFAKKKILKFFLPNGEEFDILNYRITSSFRNGSGSRPASRRNSPRGNEHKFSYKQPSLPGLGAVSSNGGGDDGYCDYIRIPYRIVPYFNVIQDSFQTVPTIEFFLKLRADYPRQCVGRDVVVEFNVPNCVSTVTLNTKVGARTQSQVAKKNGSAPSSSPHRGPAVAPSTVPGDDDHHHHQHHQQNQHHHSSKHSEKDTLSDKELSLIKQTAECVSIAKTAHNFSSAFNIDLNAQYSIHDDDLCAAESIGIGSKRQLNPARCTRKVVWRLNKFPSGVEHVLRCKFTLNYHHELTEQLLIDQSNKDKDNDDDDEKQNKRTKEFDLFQFRKIVSPIAMKFQIDNFNVSGLDIRSLRCIDWTSTRDDGGSNNGLYTTYRPYRWVRRLTKSGSYICRL